MEKIKKKIVIHSLVFSPDGVSTAYIYNDIAKGLKDAGYDVVIITTTPHYNKIDELIEEQNLKRKYFGLYSISIYHGMKVIHIPMYKFKNTLFRLFSFVYWHIFSFFFICSLRKVNLILSPSPPLTIGLASGIIARMKGVSFIYNVQEIYPDLLINSGKLKSKKIIWILKILEKKVYKLAHAITTIDQVFYNTIFPRISEIDKLHIIPNFVDLEVYGSEVTNNMLATELTELAKNKKIILYAGNIGNYQDWNPIIYAAKKINLADVEFWIIGEGVKKQFLMEEITKNNITNIRLFPYQKRETIAALNNIASVHFISINEEIENEGFPSKIYTMLASAKPTVVIAGMNTPIYNFLKDVDCSILITENREENFYQAIIKLINDDLLSQRLGMNGQKIIENNFSKEIVVGKYVKLIHNLVHNKS